MGLIINQITKLHIVLPNFMKFKKYLFSLSSYIILLAFILNLSLNNVFNTKNNYFKTEFNKYNSINCSNTTTIIEEENDSEFIDFFISNYFYLNHLNTDFFISNYFKLVIKPIELHFKTPLFIFYRLLRL